MTTLFMEAFWFLMNFFKGTAFFGVSAFLTGTGEVSVLRAFLVAVEGCFNLLLRVATVFFSSSMFRLLYLSAVGLVTMSLLRDLALARSSVLGLNFKISRG